MGKYPLRICCCLLIGQQFRGFYFDSKQIEWDSELFFIGNLWAHSPCSKQTEWSFRGYLTSEPHSACLESIEWAWQPKYSEDFSLTPSKSSGIQSFFHWEPLSPLALLQANWMEFQRISNLWTPLGWLQANWLEFKGCRSSETPLSLLGVRRVGSEVLIENELWIPLNLLGVREKSSEISTNQKSAKHSQRIFSHSICFESISQLGKQYKLSFPD